MAKAKALLPTLREKKRYLAVRLRADQPADLRGLLRDHLSQWLGVLGGVEAGARIVTCRQRTAILRCAARRVDQVRTALCAVTRVGRSPAGIEILKVSGMIRKAEVGS
jgi:ribonuclease P/MRP protein subunit POP5